MTEGPSLPSFERLVAEHRGPAALQMALRILQAIDRRYGGLNDVLNDGSYSGVRDEDAVVIFSTRFAAAFGRLLTAPDLEISARHSEQLLAQHRWVDLIFSLSGFHSSDNFLALIATDIGGSRSSFGAPNLIRLLAMLTMNSSFNIDFDQLWQVNRNASAIAFLNYISSRYVFSQRALELREQLLEWLPARLAQVKLGTLTLSWLPEVYMHCSYAFTAKKHAIKRPLMEQTRRVCLEAGVTESSMTIGASRIDRATVVVVGEQFFPGHAMFRCFAAAVQSLRDRFNLIGAIYPDPDATPIADFFDESFAIPTNGFIPSIRTVAAEIVARKPALIWYLGVGMIAQVIALASLRLAPIQCVSIGHNASTMSPMIDYFILPEDWVGARECFSEKIVALPKAAMPFLRPETSTVRRRRPRDDTIRVVISAATMKLNAVLFDAVARVAAGVKSRCEFQFSAATGGLAYFELSRIVRAKIPGAVVHPRLAYERYMEGLAQCHLFLSPFPYGGITTIMDMFHVGLPGVCLDGPEPHAHADAAIFARINLSRDLITKSVDEYVAAAIRLIDDSAWRLHCTETVRNADLDAAFFKGDARLFGEAIEALIGPTGQ